LKMTVSSRGWTDARRTVENATPRSWVRSI
jgi:hypothetical protein